jgi:hypothetical protein
VTTWISVPGTARRRFLRVALASSVLLSCASTRLKPEENHPASAAAKSIPLAPVGGALAPDYEPVPTAGGSVDDSASKWTCPMHREIIRDKPGNCPICGMKLVPVTPKGSKGAKP